MSSVSGKNILVVGGSSGIGLELARRLIDAGADLTIWSRRVPADGLAGSYLHSVVDVRRPIGEQGPHLPEPLHGLAYCPGSITLGSFSRLTEEQFLEDFDLNLLGAVRVLKHCLRSFDKSGAAVVLFSTVAVRTGFALHASVASAKGAVEGLVRSLAAELSPKRIRFNALAPSLTDTPLAAAILSTEDKRARAAQRNPLGRVGTAGDLAAAAQFLLGEESGWITGQVLSVDGGDSALRIL
ncbi:MAG: SDR family oxidoreductase [Spirochaetales bacterium]|nr:SDR family oxidoreductase [Spirochaetales bacterium]